MEDRNLITSEVIPRSTALQFFNALVETDQADLSLAVDWVHDATIKLSLADCATELRRFAEGKSVEISDPRGLLEALFALEGLRTSLDWSADLLVDYLINASRQEGGQFDETQEQYLRQTLSRFFSASDKLERTLRAQRVYAGLLPTFAGCSSIVEFRPVFDKAREKIMNGIVAATLVIHTEAESEDDLQKLSFQLDSNDIEELIAELKRLKQKQKALTQLASSQTDLLNPGPSTKP